MLYLLQDCLALPAFVTTISTTYTCTVITTHNALRSVFVVYRHTERERERERVRERERERESEREREREREREATLCMTFVTCPLCLISVLKKSN